MQDMVFSEHRGLVVANETASEASVTAALKAHDRRLVLSREVDENHRCYVWVVVRRMGSDVPAAHICDWRSEDGTPLPLTHRLVEKVNDLRVGSRAPQSDPLAHNDALQASREAEFEAGVLDAAKDIDRKLRWGVNSIPLRGPALAASRRRQRRAGENA